ncbi:MAG: prepilin-type N-terminal cleavage/methylation domain-containing protein [Parcubacteria group bacterium]
MSPYSKNNSGFTLTELLVSIAIVSVILTIVISNQSTYTDGAVLINIADEISSTISQAQVYGTGVKEFSPGSGEFSASYGLTFSLLGSGSSMAYLSFADRNGNNIYDGDWSCPIGGASECLKKVNISRGNYIDELCRVRNNPTNPYQCELGRLDISFTRPNSEAQIKFFNQSGNPVEDDPEFIGARISVRSPGGANRSVIVYYTGQISVQ